MENATITALEQQLEEKHHELMRLQASFDEYTTSSQELEQELEAEVARIEANCLQWTRKAQRMEDEVVSLRDKLEKNTLQIRQLEQQVDKLREQLVCVTTSKRQIEQEHDDVVTQVRILEATEGDLRHQLEREIEEKVFVLNDMEELKQEHALMMERLRIEVMELTSELYTLQQRKDKRERRSSTVQERELDDDKQLIETLQQELKEISLRLQEEVELRESMEKEWRIAQDQAARVEAMDNEMMEMSDELIEKSQEIRQKDLEIQRLHEELMASKVEKTILVEKNQELEAMAATNQEKETLMRLRTHLEAADARFREQLEEHQQQTNQLRDQNKTLGKHLIEVEQNFREQLQIQTQTYEEKLGALSKMNANLQQQLDSVSDSLENAKDESGRVPSVQSLQEFSPSSKLPEPTIHRLSTEQLVLHHTTLELATKYLSERSRNAALLSRLQTLCGNIQVFARVRPKLADEYNISSISKCIGVNILNQSDISAIDIRAERQEYLQNEEDAHALLESAQWRVFTFDRVLGPTESQLDVFREVEPIAQSVVEGFKACIFAYGQTGSGKTHTMEGTEKDPGLNYRVIEHIFQTLLLRGSIYDPDSNSDLMEETPIDEICYHVQLGVLEIYNETLRDLMDSSATKKQLEIRQDSVNGDIYVPDLTMRTVSHPQQTVALLRRAQANRVTGKTDVHADSSRSHCVVLLQISTQTPSMNSLDVDNNGSCVSGKLYLVDLAGSERVKKSNVSGDMLREAVHINKSLSALADVLEALDKKTPHVPYRNSKLTYLLQDVLNTSCKTVMIVNIAPTLESANESFRSMQLAERVRNIVVGRNSIVQNKKEIVSAKRAFSEIQSLKQQMQCSIRKFKQSQQTVVALKREQKTHMEQQTAKTTSAETRLVALRTQVSSLQRINQELDVQIKEEREAKQQEVEQREAAQRMLRQLTAKTRVSTSHQETLEQQLREREDEINKLRQLLTEARQRTTTAVIQRPKFESTKIDWNKEDTVMELSQDNQVESFSLQDNQEEIVKRSSESRLSLPAMAIPQRIQQPKAKGSSVSRIPRSNNSVLHRTRSNQNMTTSSEWSKTKSESGASSVSSSVSKFRRIPPSRTINSSSSKSSSPMTRWK